MSQSSQKKIVVGLGEVLWDLLPTGKQLGGAPANFAYHAHELGADTRVITRIGSDALGREILNRFEALGLRSDYVGIDSKAPTGTVSVELSSDGQPRFTIHTDVAWDNLQITDLALALMARADAVCFGSLAQRNAVARDAIRAMVAATPAESLRVFDINLRQQFFSRETIQRSLELANVLKINDQELPVLAKMFGLHGEPRAQIEDLASKFNLVAVALTRGARGSLLFSKGRFSEHSGLQVRLVDSVGAGDAFTAAMVIGFLLGCDLDEINKRANALAAYVCSQTGATPPIPDQFREIFHLQSE
jgi:fructokinase